MTSTPDGGAHTVDERKRLPRTRSRSLPRALRLTALSALLPGLGLVLTRARRLGLLLVAGAVLLGLALGAYVWRTGLVGAALGTAASPARLKVLLAGVAAGALLWMAAVALTAVLTRPLPTTRVQRLGLTAFAGLLCALIASPVALGARYVDAHLGAVDKMFADETSGSRTVLAEGAKRQDPWAGTPRVTMLLLGSDAGSNRTGVRTDTMMVASVDTATGDTVLFSIPRNLQNVPIPSSLPLHELYPGGYDCGNECLMNAVWMEAEAHAEDHPELYQGDPNPGLTATREVLQSVLGLPIQQTVIINLEGFSDLIDALGGVTIKVKDRIPLGGETWKDAEGNSHLIEGTENGWLEPGVRTLNGYQALSYSRSRVTTDDFSRMRRQRCMVAAVVDQMEPMTLLQRYPRIISAVGDNVTTDISRGDLPAYAQLVELVQAGTIRSLPFTSKNTDVADPNYSEIRYRVYDALNAEHRPAPKVSSKGTDDEARTSSPKGTKATAEDDAATSTEPTDQLEDVAAVCD